MITRERAYELRAMIEKPPERASTIKTAPPPSNCIPSSRETALSSPPGLA